MLEESYGSVTPSESPDRNNYANTLIPDLCLQNHERINFCCYSYPVGDTLFQQTSETSTKTNRPNAATLDPNSNILTVKKNMKWMRKFIHWISDDIRELLSNIWE